MREARYDAVADFYAAGWTDALDGDVGAHHRMLSTYLNALADHGLRVEAVTEPQPAADWAHAASEAARGPVFLVMGCRKAPAATP